VNSQRDLLWFRRLCLSGALFAAVVVVLGAWVRLNDAGLGCPDWPGCYGHIYPQAGFQFGKALREMIHRYFAATLGLIILSLFIWTLLRRKEIGRPLPLVAVLFGVVCLQGALGALTVTLLLKPLIVTAHLLGGLTTLGLLWWLSLDPPQGLAASRALASPRGKASPREASLKKYALVGLALLAVQIALGGWTSTNYAAVACPDFPTCQHVWRPSMDYRDAFVLWRGLDINYEGGVLANPARVAIHFTHRLGALLVGSFLITLGVLAAIRAQGPHVKFAGWLLVLAVMLQISLGIATVLFGVPLTVATLHNAGAAFLVVSMVTLLRALWPSR